MMRCDDLPAAAMCYAAAGIPLFPLVPRGKAPLIPKAHGGRGFHDATTELAQVREWWTRWPQANIGIATGRAFDVLDVDPEHDGEDTLDALRLEYGPLPATRAALTGGGGRHVLFLPDAQVRCSAGRLGPGLDVRGRGGYVVAPPSVHPNGRTYRWVDEIFPLAPWPPWLLGLIVPSEPGAAPAHIARRPRHDGRCSRYGLAVLRRACKAIEAAVEGTRHDVLRRRARTVAGYVASGEIDVVLARDCTIFAALASGLPGREAERTWQWALENGSVAPLAAPERGS